MYQRTNFCLFKNIGPGNLNVFHKNVFKSAGGQASAARDTNKRNNTKIAQRRSLVLSTYVTVVLEFLLNRSV